MMKGKIETYPTYDGLEDIISETRAWYRALGLRMGGSLYSVIRASEGITGLVHAIEKTLNVDNFSGKVHIVVEDIPSIAYVSRYGQAMVVHVGSWLYSREKMEKWHPAVSRMSENEMLVLTLGLINGAVALDMISKATESARERTIDYANLILSSGYEREYGEIYAVDDEGRSSTRNDEVAEKFVYISSAIHDILAMKACLTQYSDASWVIFPVLLFREFFDNDFALNAKELIEHDDTLDNLTACVSALRCFSKHSAKILEVNTSIGINLVKALLAGSVGSFKANAEIAQQVVSGELLSAYMAEVRMARQEQRQQSGGGQNDKEKQGKQKDGKSDKQNSQDSSPQSQGGLVKDIESSDASTPINGEVANRKQKDKSDFKNIDEFGDETDEVDIRKAKEQEGLSRNFKQRDGSSDTSNNWLEQFMRLAFNGKIKYKHPVTDFPAPRTFKSVTEYVEHIKSTRTYDSYDARTLDDTIQSSFRANVTNVYNSIDKASLKNLFMERTMDIEKSQPTRSGISLIPTRIVNMFTDEKIFSPLPENETERDSEVIILIDASGSMASRTLHMVDKSGETSYLPLYDSVVGAAYAIADGLQRAHVNCSVFAHSTLPSTDGPFVCKITDQYSMNRLNEFTSAGRILTRNNADSYALEEVAKQFGQDGHDIGRTLIVLSDGQPAFRGYRYDSNGDEMTKKAAEKLREEGIKVYSVSLTSRVVKDNDMIYGKENNFFPVDEHNRDAVSLSPMLKRIVDIVAKNSVRSANNVLTQG